MEEKVRAFRKGRLSKHKYHPPINADYVKAEWDYSGGKGINVYALDLHWLKETWENHNGILLPKAGASIHLIPFAIPDESLVVKPYAAIDVPIVSLEDFIEKAKNEAEIPYREKRTIHHVKLYPDTLFHAHSVSLDRVELSNRLSLPFDFMRVQILAFYQSLPKKFDTK